MRASKTIEKLTKLSTFVSVYPLLITWHFVKIKRYKKPAPNQKRIVAPTIGADRRE